jgi:hypothetical protein
MVNNMNKKTYDVKQIKKFYNLIEKYDKEMNKDVI